MKPKGKDFRRSNSGGQVTLEESFCKLMIWLKACLFLRDNFSDYGPINVGTGENLPIKELALLIQEIVGYQGTIVHDLPKPGGTPQKLMEVSRIHQLGWWHQIKLKAGAQAVCQGLQYEAWF